MVKPFYIGVYKYVNYNLTKGFDDWRHETVRNTDFVKSSKADREDNNTANCDGQWHINKGKIVGTESKLYDGAQIITETCKNDWKIGECLTLRFMGIAAIP
jgi:hypothetical protein